MLMNYMRWKPFCQQLLVKIYVLYEIKAEKNTLLHFIAKEIPKERLIYY